MKSQIKDKNYYLNQLRNLAEKRNISLISNKYINNLSNLEFQCNSCGKKWKDYRANIMQKIKRGTFNCPYCNMKQNSVLFNYFKELAKERGGELLSDEFYGMTKRHRWKCDLCGCEWEAKPSNIKDYPSKKGSWCPECGNKSMRKNLRKYDVSYMQELANSKPGGGEFLSKAFKGVLKIHTWKCGSCGHIWKARPYDIMGKPSRPNGTWCPECAEGRQEKICRTFFEAIFGVEFPKEHNLPWLRNHDLHLDGYNKDLKIAFERHGIQHYKFHKFFHNNDPEIFEKRKKIDNYKRSNCKKEGIILIEVGYEFKDGKLYKIKINEMEQYIRDKCKEKGIFPPEQDEKIDWRRFKLSEPDKLNELRNLAIKRNGKLLSENYFGETVPLKWYCNKHEYYWCAAPNDIRGKPSKPEGTWCPICGREKNSKAMKIIVEKRKRDDRGRFIG
ncbi:MAG: hypothetical protein R6W84_08770 [Promethearchaeia archaeon]